MDELALRLAFHGSVLSSDQLDRSGCRLCDGKFFRYGVNQKHDKRSHIS